MRIKAEEISQIIKEEIAGYDKRVEVSETGTVLSAGDGIARVHGLSKVMAGELVDLPHGIQGLVLNLEEDSVGIAIMGHAEAVREGDQVKRTGKIASVPVGKVSPAGCWTRWATPSTARDRWSPPRPGSSSSRPPGSSGASRLTSRCRPASSPSTR